MGVQAAPAARETVIDGISGGLAREGLPAVSVAASAASRSGQRKHKNLVRAEIALLLAAALFSAMGQFIPALDVRWDRTVAAIFLVMALFLKVAARHGAYDQIWFDGRAVAETVKSAAWRYAMHVPPYAGDDAEADAAFMKDVDAAVAARPALTTHLVLLPSGGQQITGVMRDLRRAEMDRRQAVYLAERVGDQIDWYAAKAAANRRAAERWFWVGLVFEVAALVLAVVAIGEIGDARLPDLVGLLAAVAIAATAWTQIDRHDELAKSYALAAYELSRLRLAVEAARDAETFAHAVEGIEAAVSREHTMWMAKRS